MPWINGAAIGIPDCEHLPIVDPRGLLRPLYDGWSVDAWRVTPEVAIRIPGFAIVNPAKGCVNAIMSQEHP